MPDVRTTFPVAGGGQPAAAPARGVVAMRLVGHWRSAGVGKLLYLSKSEREAEHLGASIHSLFPECPVLVFPRWDCLPYDTTGPSREIMGRRASVLRRLAAPDAVALVIATPEAALQRVPPRRIWSTATLRLKVADPLSVEALRGFLERTGYALDALVDEPGEAALHGLTVDLFPAGALGPVRIALEEGRIAAIHSYDPATQRTLSELPEIMLDAAAEAISPTPAPPPAADAPGASPWLCDHYPALETLFDYLADAVFVAEPGVDEHAAVWLDQIREGHAGATRLPAATNPSSSAPPKPERLFMDAPEWQRRLRRRRAELLEPEENMPVPLFATEPNPMRSYRNFIAAQLEAGRRVVLAAADGRDLRVMARRLESSVGQAVTRVAGWQGVVDAPPRGLLALEVDFEAGFVLPGSAVAVIAAADLFGSRARHSVPMASSPRDLGALVGETALQIDGPVVHVEHGLGLLRGIETVQLPGLPDQDTLRLEYGGGTMLMVPVREIGMVWGYGSAADAVSLDRLGTDAWARRQDEIAGAIRETARSLAGLLRHRASKSAPKLVPPGRDYERFAAGFPFLLTPDQLTAVEEVLSDLNSGRPMDRLLCGDVGFGKTEVALRAVAATALSGEQAAIVAPTTVLARQHFNTFRRRFAGFGVRVALLSRVVKPGELRAVKQGLRDGSIAIVVGTHAIAGKDVRFKELALLVLDEEQRFGAKVKERLRGFGEGLHVLTMSATPIPRTLQRAIVGLQSFSALETPPARRLPIRTILKRFDPALICEALRYERQRRGQSFFVCPRIEDLEPIAAQLRDIVPELRLAVVHGKMPPGEVDETVVAFADGEGDILLTTNIIETGLDIPRANTIMVWRPDRFGVAQLHQLRGRVGRGRRRGLAYLLTDPEANLPAATEKRLRTLTELDRLGAGFAVSRRDLDLRGAGDLLGEQQAGHIRLIGAELYRHLLDRALTEIETGRDSAAEAATVRLDLAASIPADYVAEPEARINLYARLARVRDLAQIDRFADEIEDRFGPPPPETRTLMDMARIGEMARQLGIKQVDAGPVAIALTFAPAEAGTLARSFGKSEDWHWTDDRVVIARPSDAASRVEAVIALLEQLNSG